MTTSRTIDELLYRLLPATHQLRDHAQGEPLRALLAILERELVALNDDTRGLYDDWFIETCHEWVIPYLGDLLGVEFVRSIVAEGFSQRAYVANALRYRRRKGTAAVLEQLARDVTGWPTRAVEYFERLTTSQHMQHIRLHAPVTATLRNANRLELCHGPFGAECHTAEVRSIAKGRGRFNIPNVGLHLFRLRAYPLERVEARAVTATGVDAGRYQFDPLGKTQPLFNQPRAETEIVHLAEERDVPTRLRRRALHAELGPLLTHGVRPPADGWFGQQPVLRVRRVDGNLETEIVPPQLCICNLAVAPDTPLTDWPRPTTAGQVRCDPETGRLAFPDPSVETPPDAVLVDYAYGFSADLGGGPYDRQQLSDSNAAPTTLSQQGVSKDHLAVGSELIHTTLGAAIDAWNVDALAAWARGESLTRVLSVMDSRTYAEDLSRTSERCLLIPPGCHLRLLAAQWPAEVVAAALGGERRSVGRIDLSGVRPHVMGNLDVLGLADPAGAIEGGSLELNGLLLEGAVTVLPGSLRSLVLRHCTLVPGLGGLRVGSTEPLAASPAPAPFNATALRALATNAGLSLELARCIADGITLTGSVNSVTVRDCVLSQGAQRLEPGTTQVGPLSGTTVGQRLVVLAASTSGVDVAAVSTVLAAVPDVRIDWTPRGAGFSLLGQEANATIETSTLLGELAVRALEGSESLFVKRVQVHVVQEGCLRYSYADPQSRTPQRFRCQPDLALAAAQGLTHDRGESWTEAKASAVAGRVRPLFSATTYGHPAYVQLARAAAEELTTGAEDGSEMGAFCLLKQAHRESNLRAALEQYLRFGLEAGLIFNT